MNTFRKVKSLFSVLLIILIIFSAYLYSCSNTQSINLSIFITLMAALLGFIDGLEYIIIKKSTKIGYLICTLSILLPIPIIILTNAIS